MNRFKENPFLSGLVVATVLLGGILIYLILDASSASAKASEDYSTAVQSLHKLQNRVPFPSPQNLAQLQGDLDQYSAQVTALRAQLAKMAVPLDKSVTPQQFQDGLRVALNELREKAAANAVKLPENFYFGFDQYQTQAPSDVAAPYLKRQFLIIQALVTRLVDFRVQSIDEFKRDLLPQEGNTPPPANAAPRVQEAQDAALKRFPFDITFTAEQGRLRIAFNSLLDPAQFLIVRSVVIQNSSPVAPSKTFLDTSASPLTSDTSAAAQKNLQVILGREFVQAKLRIEALDFTEPTSPATK